MRCTTPKIQCRYFVSKCSFVVVTEAPRWGWFEAKMKAKVPFFVTDKLS